MLMRAALGGDNGAYRQFLDELAPTLRALARRNFERAGVPLAEVEDAVQETLLAIHLKRHTWLTRKPIRPWVWAIARNKTIDTLRRHRRRVEVPIEDFSEMLPSREGRPDLESKEIDRYLALLPAKQQMVVRAIATQGATIRQTAQRTMMKEGAVRVALHRGLASLAAKLRTAK